MEVTINYNGQAVAVEVTLEVYEFLDRADHKAENLSHEQRRHWDGREFDEYTVSTEGVGIYGETPEEYLCRMETLGELMAVLDTCTEAQRRRFLLYPALKRKRRMGRKVPQGIRPGRERPAHPRRERRLEEPPGGYHRLE